MNNARYRGSRILKIAFIAVGACACLLLLRPAGVSAQDPVAARKTQGSGIRIVLDRSFIDEYADKVTMKTDFVVHRAGSKHSAAKDGEQHIAGVAEEARLATVAELMNPADSDVDFFKNLAGKTKAAERRVEIEGVVRFWCEHAGTSNQSQGARLPSRFPNSNPDHVFEIHPITKLDGRSLLDTLKPIKDFKPKDASAAIMAYENVPCHIRKDRDQVVIDTKGVGFNFVELIVDPDEERDPNEVSDGRFVLCQLRDTDGELIARRRRVVFVKGTVAEAKSRTIGEGRLQVIGIPRINLRLVQWRLDHATDPDFESPLDWDLPYEIVVVGLVKELPAADDD